MAQQSDHLKHWIRQQGASMVAGIHDLTEKGCHVLAITSGKGGVGKSTLALNLALAMADRGQRVILLDADLGLANINIMLGVVPRRTLWDVVLGTTRIDEVVEPGPHGIRLISGVSGVAEMARLSSDELNRLVEGFQALEGQYDWFIVDTGAGLSPSVLAFVLGADEALVVTQAEPTALADAYGLIKTLWEESYGRPIHLVLNRSTNAREGQRAAERISELAARALSVQVDVTAVIREDAAMHRALISQTPALLREPGSWGAADITALADRLLNRPQIKKGGMRGFWDRVMQTLQASRIALPESERENGESEVGIL